MEKTKEQEAIEEIANEVDIVILNDGEYTPRGSYLLAMRIATRLYELGYRVKEKETS